MVRWLLYLVFVVIAYLILRTLGPVLFPIVAAAAVAYLLDGWVDALEDRGMKRSAAVGLLLALFLIVVTGLIVIAVPLITAELRSFIAALPSMVEEAAAWCEANLGIEVDDRWREYLADPKLKDFIGSSAGPLAGITAGAVGGILGFLGVLAELLLIPVFAFYIMVDWDKIVDRVHSLIPARYRESVSEIAVEIDAAVSTWIRGQLIVTTILGVLYAVAFKVLGVPMGLVIGATVGLLTIIPFLGTLVGAGLTAIVLGFNWPGPGVAISVVVVFVVLHLLEAAILTPKLVGKKVGLGELGALFAVLAGGQLLGFVGVLLAVPLAAAVAVLLRRVFAYYEGSHFFRAGAPGPEPVRERESEPVVVAGTDSVIVPVPIPETEAETDIDSRGREEE